MTVNLVKQERVTIGRLVVDGAIAPHPSGCTFAIDGEDIDLGEPVPKEIVLSSLMQDGSLVKKVGDDNREAGFLVRITGKDTVDLSKGEEALAKVLGKRTEMVWRPLDGIGPTTVFDVLTSGMKFLFNDVDELQRKRWTFRVRLICLPFGRSPDLVTVAGDIIGDGTTFNACDSATGWTARRAKPDGGDEAMAITVDTSTKYQGTGSLKTSGAYWRTDYQDYSSTPYAYRYRHTYDLSGVSVAAGYYSFVIRAEAAGAPATDVSAFAGGNNSGSWYQAGTEALGNGWYRVTFNRPAGYANDTSIGFTIQFSTPYTPTPPTGTAWLDLVESRSGSSSTRQSVRGFDVLGSVRSPGSLAIEHDTTALGDVLVWMGEDRGDGYRPDMRRWRGTWSSDDQYFNMDAVSGYYSAQGTSGTNTTVRFAPPAKMFSPGSYVAVMRALPGSSQATLTATLHTNGASSGVAYGDTAILSSAISGGWDLHTLGVIELPPTRVDPSSTAALVLELEGVINGTGILDELWLFRVDDVSTLLHVDCGGSQAPSSAGPYNRLWVDTPSIDQPRGGVWVGTQANRSDARHPGSGLKGKAIPNLLPPQTQLFIANTGATGAKPTLTYYPHSHTHNSVGASDG